MDMNRFARWHQHHLESSLVYGIVAEMAVVCAFFTSVIGFAVLLAMGVR